MYLCYNVFVFLILSTIVALSISVMFCAITSCWIGMLEMGGMTRLATGIILFEQILSRNSYETIQHNKQTVVWFYGELFVGMLLIAIFKE